MSHRSGLRRDNLTKDTLTLTWWWSWSVAPNCTLGVRALRNMFGLRRLSIYRCGPELLGQANHLATALGSGRARSLSDCVQPCPRVHAGNAEGNDEEDLREGNLHVASFEESGWVAPPKVIELQGAPAEHAPLDLSADQLRVFVGEPDTGATQLQVHDLSGEEPTQLSSVVVLPRRFGMATRFTQDTVYVSDEAFNTPAFLVDLSDPAAPTTLAFPPTVSVVFPLPAASDATTSATARVLGWGVQPDDGTSRMTAFRSAEWAIEDPQLVDGAVWGAAGLGGRQKLVF